jgi:hypothetical protein
MMKAAVIDMRYYAFQCTCSSFCIWSFDQYKNMCNFHWSSILRLGSMAARLLGLQVQIMLGAFMSVSLVSVVCCQADN